MSLNVVPASSGLNVELYTSGLFGRNLTSNQAQLNALQQSGFTTIVFWTLHVESDGTLLYNNIPIVKDGCFVNTFNYLPELLTELISTGSVQNLLFSIGSGWPPNSPFTPDFQNIQKLLATTEGTRKLRQSFNALATALPISGYDFDDETLYDPTTTAQLTEMLCAGNSMIVTYCPYSTYEQTAWNQALEQTYTWDQQQNPPLGQSVQWWNLQCYGGGTGNDPLTWAKNLPTDAGITNPQAFIVPGYDTSQSPAEIQQTFAQYAGTGINGGFIWNSAAIFASAYTPQQYAQAIIYGLQGTGGSGTGEPAVAAAVSA
jgi:hypothetical protein